MRDIQSPGRAQVWRRNSSDAPINNGHRSTSESASSSLSGQRPAQTLAGPALHPTPRSSHLLHTLPFLPLFLLLIFPVFLISPKLRKSLGPVGPPASASWHLSVLRALG